MTFNLILDNKIVWCCDSLKEAKEYRTVMGALSSANIDNIEIREVKTNE